MRYSPYNLNHINIGVGLGGLSTFEPSHFDAFPRICSSGQASEGEQSMNAQQADDHQVVADVSKEMWDELEQIAKEAKCSVPEWVSWALEDHVGQAKKRRDIKTAIHW